MDLVDEEDRSVVEVREQSGQIGGALEDGPGGLDDRHLHLGREDRGERGLAEPGRPVQEDVVERLPALHGGLDRDPELLAERLLPHELLQALRP